MSKFNETKISERATTNHMGAKAYKQSEKEELAFAVTSSFIEDSYYESKDERIKRIQSLVKKIATTDPIWLAKLALVTRKEFHMRSAYHILVAELAKYHKGDSLVKNLMAKSVERPDDLLEIVGYLGKPIPNSVKKGVAAALEKFNGHQLAKYRGENKEFKLVDLLNLVHPKSVKRNEEYKKLVAGELKSANTWEVRSSSGEDKAQMWGELIGNDELGYMALLRNLRNIIKTADDDTVKEALSKLTNKEAVLKSKQLPFRFLSAFQAIEGMSTSELTFEADKDRSGSVIEALNTAVGYSVENIPLLKGRTVILSDNSGSMSGDGGGASVTSAYSNKTTADIANLFATLYWTRAENTLVGLFGDKLVTPVLDRNRSLFENFNILNKAANTVGGATETGIFVMMEKLIKEKIMVDRIIIFSDCQIGTGCNWFDTGSRHGDDFGKLFKEYQKINPSAIAYSVDLKGYGNTAFSDNVVTVAGWSDKIFDIMQMHERKEGLVKYIEEYEM